MSAARRFAGRSTNGAGRAGPARPGGGSAGRGFGAVTAVLAGLAVIAATLTGWAGGQQGAGRAASSAPAGDAQQALEALGALPLSFVENRGQLDSRVRYHAQGSDFAFFVTPEEVMMSFAKEPRVPAAGPTASAKHTGVRGVNLGLRFLAANPQAEPEGHGASTARVNYLRGDDPDGWHTGLPTYDGVVYEDLWPGVDMVLRGEGGQLKYEFRVRPGARVRDVGLAYAGAKRLRLGDDGDLRIQTALGTLRDSAPVSYQVIEGERVPVDSRYVLGKDTQYGFAVGRYDADETLVIDPSLDYSTFVGGASMDRAEDVTVDADGNAIVVGTTQSEDFPVTPGAVDETFNGGVVDVFVAKLNADGSGLVYATYLGGVPTTTPSGNTENVEFGRAVTVDGTGNAYVAGQTSSGDFPVTDGAFQEDQQVGQNTAVEGFVSKLDSTGGLVYSTFLGGTGSDDVRSVAVDADGNAYLAGGTTSSTNFPVTTGAFDTAHNGGEDVFVAKLDSAGSALAYSTLLGGADNELANGIAVDASGNAFVGGATRSVGFPTTAGVFQPSHSGGDFADLFEGFLTKVDPTGSGLVYSTFLGGTEIDRIDDVAIDGGGNAYVVGGTLSPTFPTTAGAFDTAFDGNDGFVTKLTADASSLAYSTFLGVAQASSIALDADDNAWLGGDADAGATTTADAFQVANAGGNDAYIAQLNGTGSDLTFATYLGGTNSDFATGIALDPLGDIYVAGTTISADFPTTPGAFDRTFGGDPSIFWGDAFVAKFTTGATTPPADDTTAPTVSISSPAAGSTVSGTVTVAADASDDVGVTEVRFLADGTLIGTDTTAPYEISWDTTTVANGSHTLTATALDAAGNTGTSDAVSVTVDNTTATEPALSSLTLDPAGVTGGESSTGTVTLTSAAPAGGASVTLSSSDTTVATVPAGITVPEGSTSANFTVTTASVSADTSASISATFDGLTRTATLTVNAAQGADTVSISRAEYDADKEALRVEATSSDSTATLTVHVTETDEVIGTLSEGRGEFSWPTNPESITVRSSLGGSDTTTVTLK